MHRARDAPRGECVAVVDYTSLDGVARTKVLPVMALGTLAAFVIDNGVKWRAVRRGAPRGLAGRVRRPDDESEDPDSSGSRLRAGGAPIFRNSAVAPHSCAWRRRALAWRDPCSYNFMMSKKPKPLSEEVFRAEMRKLRHEQGATTKALADAIVRTNEATTRVLVETIVATNGDLRREFHQQMAGLLGEVVLMRRDIGELGGRIENALVTTGTAHRSVAERVEVLEREVDALKKRT